MYNEEFDSEEMDQEVEVNPNPSSKKSLRPKDYSVEDVFMPAALNGWTIDKEMFLDACHQHGLTIDQTRGLWKVYTDVNIDNYTKAVEQMQQQENAKAQEAQQAEERQEVISTGDGLHLTREEAQAEANRIVNDPQSDYWNDKVSPDRRDKAIAYVHRCREIAQGLETTIEGYYTKHLTEKQERMKELYGTADLTGEIRKSSSGQRAPENIDTSYHDIGDGSKQTHSASGQRIEDIE